MTRTESDLALEKSRINQPLKTQKCETCLWKTDNFLCAKGVIRPDITDFGCNLWKKEIK